MGGASRWQGHSRSAWQVCSSTGGKRAEDHRKAASAEEQGGGGHPRWTFATDHPLG